MMEIAVVLALVNIITALIVVGWCNQKIKEFTDKDKWK